MLLSKANPCKKYFLFLFLDLGWVDVLATWSCTPYVWVQGTATCLSRRIVWQVSSHLVSHEGRSCYIVCTFIKFIVILWFIHALPAVTTWPSLASLTWTGWWATARRGRPCPSTVRGTVRRSYSGTWTLPGTSEFGHCVYCFRYVLHAHTINI